MAAMERIAKNKMAPGSAANLVFGSKYKTRKEHAHFNVEIDPEPERNTLRMAYYARKAETEDNKPPHLEDASNWLATFFTSPIVVFDVFSVFKYNKQYSSVLRLDYPLLVGNDLLLDTSVVGHDIAFLSDSMIDTASINVAENGFLIFLQGHLQIDLTAFNIHEIVGKFGQYANALVEKKKKEN